jgi:glycerophosphoryl diester phosphodiesterase
MSSKNGDPVKRPSIQGHRGARGLFPENTIIGFIEAARLGVDILEMDVVISKDRKVVVSHEPWMNEIFCSQPGGGEIEKHSSEKYNLYNMNYEEIRRYDCGLRGDPEFPFQKKSAVYKPLLSEVIAEVETFTSSMHLKPVVYNIEIKSEEASDGIFHPEPADFVKLVYKEIKHLSILDRAILQSFDLRILQKIREIDPEIKTGLLIENEPDPGKDLKQLGFLPYSYNPHFSLVNTKLVNELHRLNVQVAVWTVNEIKDMVRLVEMGVDSIITDYPDKALQLMK